MALRYVHIASISMCVCFKICVDLACMDLKAIRTVEEPLDSNWSRMGYFMLFHKRVKYIYYKFRMSFNRKDNKMGKYVIF